MEQFSNLPPPPKGQVGLDPNLFAHLPPPPQGQSGMTLEEIMSQPNQKKTYGSTSISEAGRNLADIGVGAAKGALSSLTGAAQLGVKGLEMTGLVPQGTSQNETAQLLKQSSVASNEKQQLGKNVEQIAEFFIPASFAGKYKLAIKASHMPASLKALSLIGIGAAEGAVPTAIQGGTGKQVKTAAIISGAIPAAGLAVESNFGQRITKYLSEKIPSRFMNSLIKPREKDFNFGKNPGLSISKEGITANTRGSLLGKIAQKKQEIGQQIENALAKESGKSLDLAPVISKEITLAKQSALKSGDKALYNRLQDIEEGLTKEFAEQATETGMTIAPTGAKNLVVSPLEAQKIKIQVGKDTRWTGQLFDNDVNKVRVKIYKAIDQVLDGAVQGIDDLNQRYGNILTAEKALERTDKNIQRLVTIGLRSGIVGSAVAGSSIASGKSGFESAVTGAATTLGIQGLQSTAVVSRLSKFLVGLSQAEQSALIKAIPALKNIILGSVTKGEASADNNSDQ